MAFCNHSFKFLWRTVNSKPPSMPYRIVACTFCHSLSRNSCIQQSWPYVWSIMTAYLLLNAPHVRESELWNVSFEKISIQYLPNGWTNGIFWGEITQSGKFLNLESGIRNYFCYWKREGQGIQKPQTIGIQDSSSTDKEWNPTSGIRNPRLDSLTKGDFMLDSLWQNTRIYYAYRYSEFTWTDVSTAIVWNRMKLLHA